MATYRVFVRNWWREADPSDGPWPNNLVPDGTGRKTTLPGGRGLSLAEALARCEQYNATHKPGRYSRKAELCEEK